MKPQLIQALLMTFLGCGFAFAVAAQDSLTLLSSQPLFHEAQELTEPSGLAYDAKQEVFWTVSDDTKELFRLTGSGALDGKVSVPDKGFEGVSLGWDNDVILTVEEDRNRIVVIDANNGDTLRADRLKDLQGYDRIKKHFDDSDDNKGLEGITVDPAGKRVFVVKEAKPRLLIELSSDLSAIVDAWKLDQTRGFDAPKLKDKKLDISGLTFDAKRNALWMASANCGCFFLFSLDNHTARLVPTAGGAADRKLMEKIEGVAWIAETDQLAAVSDREDKSRFFRLQIH